MNKRLVYPERTESKRQPFHIEVFRDTLYRRIPHLRSFQTCLAGSQFVITRLLPLIARGREAMLLRRESWSRQMTWRVSFAFICTRITEVVPQVRYSTASTYIILADVVVHLCHVCLHDRSEVS